MLLVAEKVMEKIWGLANKEIGEFGYEIEHLLKSVEKIIMLRKVNAESGTALESNDCREEKAVSRKVCRDLNGVREVYLLLSRLSFPLQPFPQCFLVQFFHS